MFTGCIKYLVDALSRFERMFGTFNEQMNPSKLGEHPELDDTPVLDDSEHQKFQMLIGMLVWLVTISRVDVAHATALI